MFRQAPGRVEDAVKERLAAKGARSAALLWTARHYSVSESRLKQWLDAAGPSRP